MLEKLEKTFLCYESKKCIFSDTVKTCTVTFQYGRNYGAFLQAWALQQFLGKSNCILNFIPSYRYKVSKKWQRKLPFFWRFVALKRYLHDRPLEDISKLKLSRKYHRQEDVIENPPNSDVYIAGSDQIWHAGELLASVYFLAFGSSNIKRVSYAASGVREWSNDFIKKVLPYLKNFNAISVREEASVPFLNSIGLKNVAVTCDPTILWIADFYRFNFSDHKMETSKHIFVYRIRGSINNIQNFLDGKKTVIVDMEKNRTIVSVSQWLNYIDTSESVITDSFHGTIFSILFHKPFAIFPTISKMQDMNDRFFTLLGKVKLEYRLLSGNETKEEIEEILYRPIDWGQVDKILEEWRNYSKIWLMEAIAK